MTGESPASGNWVEINRPLYVLDPITCTTCGAMIPSRYWDAGEGLERPYCSPSCQVLEARVVALRKQWDTGEETFPSRMQGA